MGVLKCIQKGVLCLCGCLFVCVCTSDWWELGGDGDFIAIRMLQMQLSAVDTGST